MMRKWGSGTAIDSRSQKVLDREKIIRKNRREIVNSGSDELAMDETTIVDGIVIVTATPEKVWF